MKRFLNIGAVLLLSFSLTATAQADPPIGRCIPYIGMFHMTSAGLVVTVSKEDDKQVKPHTERIANPPASIDTDHLVKRGTLQFEGHIDKESGRLFVHWKSLQPAK